jgi:hypothetical protein
MRVQAQGDNLNFKLFGTDIFWSAEASRDWCSSKSGSLPGDWNYDRYHGERWVGDTLSIDLEWTPAIQHDALAANYATSKIAIDTTRKAISIWITYVMGHTHSYYQDYQKYEMHFDNIPYTDSDNSIVVPYYTYDCTYDAQSNYDTISSDPNRGHNDACGGNWWAFGVKAIDSIGFSIPLSMLRATVTQAVPQSSLAIVVSSKKLLFKNSGRSNFEVYSALGQCLASESFAEGSEEVYCNTQLLPGLYFARLTSASGASEVVKFVVTP